MGGLWSVMTVVGPIILALVILYALFRNRKASSDQEIARTERGTRELREELNREDTRREAGEPPR